MLKTNGDIGNTHSIIKENTRKLIDRKGFSLAEVLIVVAIIGIFILVALPDFRDSLLYSRRTSCEAEVKILGDAVVNYYAETGLIPSAGIDSLKSELTRDDMEVDGRKVGPWLKENMSTVDPWGQEYEYTVTGNKYEICSKGDPAESEPICYNKIGRKAKS